MSQETETSTRPKEPKLSEEELDQAANNLILRAKNILQETPEFTQALAKQFLEGMDLFDSINIRFNRGDFLYEVDCAKEIGLNVPGYEIDITKYAKGLESKPIQKLKLEGKVDGHWWNRITFNSAQDTLTVVQKAEEFLTELKGN